MFYQSSVFFVSEFRATCEEKTQETFKLRYAMPLTSNVVDIRLAGAMGTDLYKFLEGKDRKQKLIRVCLSHYIAYQIL